MEDDVKTVGDYVSIAWRRKFHILIPFFLVLMVTIPTVFLLPSVYKSTGTILIESQQIPTELIQSTVTSFADERIQVITQRIMTSQQLFGIIKKSAEEPTSCMLIAFLAEHGIEKVSISIYRPIQVAPSTTDLHVCLVQVPRAADPASSLRSEFHTYQLSESILPGTDGFVADLEASLEEKFCYVTETKLVS